MGQERGPGRGAFDVLQYWSVVCVCVCVCVTKLVLFLLGISDIIMPVFFFVFLFLLYDSEDLFKSAVRQERRVLPSVRRTL